MLPRLSLLLTFLASACATTTVLPPHERDDDPDAAAEYRALKQAGSDDPTRSLASAREAMRQMAEYSTIDDAWRPAGTGRQRERSAVTNAGAGGRGNWQFLGPGNIGGRTRVLSIDPSEPRIMYTAGVSGGIWKTYDGGLQWEPIGDDLANIAVNSLVMDPTDSRVLYAGTGEGYFREVIRGTALPLRGDGIFVTRDAGETWLQLPNTVSPDFHFVNDLVISPANPTRIYAATRTGVWRSDDSGATWSRILPVTVMGGCLDLAYRAGTSGDYLFASCGTLEQATVWRAKNAESSGAWESVLSAPNMGRTSLAIAPSDPTVVYALSATNASGPNYQGLQAVYRSSASGDAGSWQPRATPATGLNESQLLSNATAGTRLECLGQPGGSVTMGWYCNTIAVDPADANRVWVGGVDLFRSDDGGASFGVASYWWAPEAEPTFVHADQHAIVFHPGYDGSSVRTMFVTNDGGVFRTDDAAGEIARGNKAACNSKNSKMRFQSLNNSYGVTQFYHGAVSPDGTRYVAGAQDNGTLLGRTTEGPNQWRRILGGDGAYVAYDPTAPRYMYAESQWANMHRSENDGQSFMRIVAGLPTNVTAEFLFITPFVVDGAQPTRLWLGGRAMWVTANRGDQWTRASTVFPGMVSAMAVEPGNSDRVIAGLATGHIARSEQATTATAATPWTLVQPREGFVSSIAFDPHDASIVYATYAGFGGKHVWMSTDRGATWTSLDGNLPDMPVHSLVVDPTRLQRRIYLGTDLGVFVTLDGGQTWAVENTGFANAVTETVAIAKGTNGPAIYAFTHGRGAWRAELLTPGPKRRGVRR